MSVNIWGLISILVFYAIVAVAGIWAARFTRMKRSSASSETMIVGARDVGFFLGLCTMSATWIGGSEITATAEAVFTPGQGLLWSFAVPGYAVGLVVNAIFFVRKMRNGNYTTTIDPFQAKLGKYFGLVVFFIEMTSETLYAASILSSLGGTLEVMVGISRVLAVIISASIAIFYTMLGGLYSVAYTDVIQLFILLMGMAISLPFVLTSEAVGNIAENAAQEGGWIGEWDANSAGTYFDFWMLVIFGGIPVQQVYQRVFSASTTKQAQVFLVGAAIISCVSVVPSMLIGAAGASTNWSLTSYMNGSGESPLDFGDQRLILPVAVQYLTPPAVACLVLGAVSAAGMSSLDSVLLAQGSLFGRNVYGNMIRKGASEREKVIAMRTIILLVGVAAVALSLATDSVLALLFVCADFCFVTYFPLFALLLYSDPNVYGATIGILVGLVLRLGGGDYLLDWQPLFQYPGSNNFPVKTVSAFSTFISCYIFSVLARFLFERGYIPEKYDFFRSCLARGGRSIYIADIKERGRLKKVEMREIVQTRQNVA